jgi:hypothetical protein
MPVCEHKNNLITEWQGALKAFSTAVKRLQDCNGDADKFAVEHRATELARLHAENARMMVEHHRTEHGC